MNKIKTIIDKEWSEVFKNPMVLMTVLLLPLFFTILPLVILYTMGTGGSSSAVADMPPQFAQACGDLTGADCAMVFLVNQFMMMFMMLPLAIPAVISAYSIVGEKTTRCLEPLLATPITTTELISGKAAAAAIPAVGASWLAFAIFAVGANLIVHNPAVVAQIVDLRWLLSVIVVGPLMAIAAVNVSIIISSRVSDPRAAEQISMLILLPLLAVFFAQMMGLILLNVGFILMTIVVLVIVDVALIYLGTALFQRETILTRWK